jgi:hypothetical protein
MQLICVGAVIAAVGWLFLLFGTDASSIPSNTIQLGYFLAIIGALVEKPERIREWLERTIEKALALAKRAKPTSNNLDVEYFEQEFRRAFNVTAQLSADNSIVIVTRSGPMKFSNVEDAWIYCIQYFYPQNSAA